MRRHVVLFISGVVCLLLLVVTFFAFVSTLVEAYRVQRIHGQSEVRLHLSDGSIVLTSFRRADSAFRARWDTYWLLPGALEGTVSDLAAAATTRRGFGPVRWLVGTIGGADFTLLRFPFWPLLLVLPVPPIWWGVVAYRAHQKRGLPLCPVCGYDLSGCVKRCTECNWTMPYPLALRLAIRRETLRRMVPPEPSRPVTTSVLLRTKRPAASAAGSVR
jgi:hypothetical protein